MSTKKTKQSTISETKELFKDLKESHKQSVDKIMVETYQSDDMVDKLRHYNSIKKMKWWSYALSLLIALILSSIAVILWFYSSKAVTSYYVYGVVVGIVIIMMMVNYAKNRSAALHFNDRRRRYQRIFSDQEAHIFLTLKIMFLSLILFLPTMISFAILANQ